MRFTSILTALCVATFAAPTAEGNNNLFLPGDACFPTVITAEILEKLQANRDGRHAFEYSSFDGYEQAFCGYAGDNRASVAVNKAFVANLAKAYRHIRQSEDKRLVEVEENGKTKLVETNGIRVLFYRKDFEFPRFRIGLQYNENWVEETVKFGHRAEHIRLCCLVDDKHAIMESRRDAARVGSLDVTLPDVKLVPLPMVNAPVIVKGEVKAIVLRSKPLTEYLRPEDLNTFVRIVDSERVLQLLYSDGEWTETPIRD